MASTLTLMRALKRITLFRPGQYDYAGQHRELQWCAQTARAMAYFFGESEAAVDHLAHTVLRQRRMLRSGRHAGLPLARGGARQVLAAALEHGACLLALPFNPAAIDLLRDLSNDPHCNLVLIESPLVRALLAEFQLTGRAIVHCTQQQVIGHVKAGAASAKPVTYVSFPELHVLGHGTTATVSFFDQPCQFSLLEPLLCRYGVQTLLTLACNGDGVSGLQLVTWQAGAGQAPEPAAALRIPLVWLFGHLQGMAATWPGDTFSWPQLYRASLHCYQIERANQLKQLEAYFDAWRSAPAGLSEPTHQFAKARLAALRDPS